MARDTKQKMLFKDIFHKKVVADFDGGDASSDAGLLFLRQVEAKTGIIKTNSGCTQRQKTSRLCQASVYPSFETVCLSNCLRL
jgi:hypothetical protein